MRAWFQLAAVVAGIAGCTTTEPDEVVPEPGYGEGLGTPENPIPQDNATYAVRSRIEPDAAAPLPSQVTSVVSSLRAFSEAPGQTLLATAAGANVPELAQLYGTLPASLTSQLAGWIDAELDAMKIAGSPIRDYADRISSFAEIGLTRFALDSTMSFTPTRTAHTLTGIVFQVPGGATVVVPIGGLKADVIAQQVPVLVAEGGLITFGDHEFGLAFGEHAWHGLNMASDAAFGSDVATAFGTIDCAGLSWTIASKCVDGQCVGHQGEIKTVCERGLDLLVTEFATRVGAFDSDVVRYVAGTARLVDENRDGLADRIANGIWESELIMGPTRGTFTAFAEGR